ncbi:MAG: DUF2752 domain-containing protein [Arcicella sp.]|nr:DUF2752 domain-containing protein [Arcicella sp.]
MNLNKILLAVLALSITAFYFFWNPAEISLFPSCPFKTLTGFYCPGCGGQRAFHAILHGDFEEAFHNNLLIFLVIPIAFYKIILELNGSTSKDVLILNYNQIWIFLSLLFLFTLLRNIPLYPLNQLIPLK